MADRKQFRLGLVGYGEIGSTLGAGLRRAGLESIACYDKYAFDGPYADLIQTRAREAGVALVRSNGELADASGPYLQRDAGLVIARERGRLRTRPDGPAHLCRLRLGDAQDQEDRGRQARLERGAPWRRLDRGHAAPRLFHAHAVERPAGERVRDLLVPWGMQIEFTGPALGTASGHQILRSVLIKGIEALTDEMLLAARQYGIDEVVLASASKTLARPWMDTVQSLTPSGAIHAKRRAEELEMSADAVEDAGVEPIMARAVAARLRWKESLGLKDHFKGVVPRTYQEALEAIELKAGLKKSELA